MMSEAIELIQDAINVQVDDAIYNAVTKVGINIDKEKLIEAIEKSKEVDRLIDIGKSANKGWAENDYIRGMYNAFEWLQACLEHREPIYEQPFIAIDSTHQN